MDRAPWEAMEPQREESGTEAGLPGFESWLRTLLDPRLWTSPLIPPSLPPEIEHGDQKSVCVLPQSLACGKQFINPYS